MRVPDHLRVGNYGPNSLPSQPQLPFLQIAKSTKVFKG